MTEPQTKPGIGVDSKGNPVIDPTVNVRSIVEASGERLDGLRLAEGRRLDELREMAIARMDDLRKAETMRVNGLLELHMAYAERLTIAEAKRIDAIRAVDVNAVAVASQRAADQASVLANQVAQSAEALRGLVATTAGTVAVSQQQLATQLTARLTVLEQAQYEGKGKQSYQDPVMAELVVEMRKQREVNAATGGMRGGSSAVVAYVISGISVLAVVITLAITLMRASGH